MENGYPDPRTCRVIESDMESFLGEDTNWYLFRYGIKDELNKLHPKGTYTNKMCDDAKIVVQRARQALKDGFSQYNIVGNNCEDFANYCKTGQRSMESAQFSEALERVAVARCAMASGYRSPLVFAGCVMGLFTSKDFKDPPVNYVPDTTNSQSEESSGTDEENGSKDKDENSGTDRDRVDENKPFECKGNNTNTNNDSSKDETDSIPNKPRDSILVKTHDNTALMTTKTFSNGGSRKKVNFDIPTDRREHELN